MSDAAADDEFDRVVADNTADLHGYLLRRLRDPDDAAEALNDVLLTAWRRRDRLPAESHDARLWLFGVAANIQRNQQRARNRRSALVRRLMSDPTAWNQGGDGASGHDAVRDAIDSLPSELSELVRLHHWDGFSLVEAATILDIPASTARTRYAAARRALKRTLDAEGEQEPGPARSLGPKQGSRATLRA